MKSKYLIIVGIISILPLLAFNQQRWEVTLGIPDKSNYLFNKTYTYDSGYLINFAEEAGGIRVMLKTDVNGMELWRKAIINDGLSVQPSALSQNDQQIIVGGSTEGFPFILSLNPCGEKNWCSKFINFEYASGHIQDVTILENNNVLALVYMEPVDLSNKTDRIYIFCYDTNGILLWKKLYASRDDYPLMEFPLPYFITKFNNYIIISGYCYYPFPSNPTLMGMRPLFIRIDSLFNEQYVLPYGVNDSLIGFGAGVIEVNQTKENIAVGSYKGPLSYVDNTVIMHFDSLGTETGFELIPNNAINSTAVMNWSIDIVALTNHNYILNSNFGDEPYGNPFGELLIDSTYNVIDYLTHENTTSNITRINSLKGEKYLFATNIYENPPVNYKKDILLYKLNADLSQAAVDTNTYVYDSLCDNLPIISDTIYLDSCNITTGIEEIQTPEEYYSNTKTIPVHIFPNPATSDIIFEFENIGNHRDILLICYDVNGSKLFEQLLPFNQTQIITSVSNWKAGMYIAIASSSTGGSGNVKFMVR